MTVFESIHSKNIDELVEWLDKNGAYNQSPWERWFNANYCRKCKPVVTQLPYLKGEHVCNWCEANNGCVYFQDMKKIPNRRQVIRLWLESEI